MTSQTLEQGSPTFLKLRATSWYKFMRRATNWIHTLMKWNLEICLQLSYH